MKRVVSPTGSERRSGGAGATGTAEDVARGLAAATATIAVLTATSRVLGFLRETVYASVFGASAELDAFLVAQGVPNLVVGLVSSAIATAATPLLAGVVARGDREKAARTFSALANLVMMVTAVAMIPMALMADGVVRLMAPGFTAEQVRLAAGVTRVLLIASLFVTWMNLLTGWLHACRRFFWPASTGIPFNVAMIAAALFFGARYGAYALAVGFTVGSLLRVLVQLPGVRRTGFRHRWCLDLADPGLRAILGLLPALFLGYAVTEVNVLVDRMVASTQEEGTISALNYAFRLVTLPHGLLAMALVQALYPSLGAVSATADREAFARLLGRGLGVLVGLLTPMTVALVVLRVPIVEFVYGRGSFDARDTLLTSLALAAYGLGLVPLALRDLANRALYAWQDARYPAMVAVVAMLVNVVGDLMLGRWLGITGLALATTLSFTIGFALLAARLGRRYRALPWYPLAATAVKALAAGVVAGMTMDAAYRWLRPVWAGGASGAGTGEALAELALVTAPGLAGCAVYAGCLVLLRVREAEDVLEAARRLVNRLAGRGRYGLVRGAAARLPAPTPGRDSNTRGDRRPHP
ncbi:MAG: murein biosynthesis integral membrane protein MurJ [Symbiobacteriaceae bacterium]